MEVPRLILGLSIIILLLCNFCVGQDLARKALRDDDMSTTQNPGGFPNVMGFPSMNNMRIKLGGPPPLPMDAGSDPGGFPNVMGFPSMNNMRIKLGGPPPLPMDAGSGTTGNPNNGMTNNWDEKRINMRGPLEIAPPIAMVDPMVIDPKPMGQQSTFPPVFIGTTIPSTTEPYMAGPMPFPGPPQFPMSPPNQFPGPPRRFPMAPPVFRPRPAWNDDDDDDDDCPFQNLGMMLPMFFPEFLNIGRMYHPVFGAPRLTSFFFRGPMLGSLMRPLLVSNIGFGMGHGEGGHGWKGHGTTSSHEDDSSEESDEHSDLDDEYEAPFNDDKDKSDEEDCDEEKDDEESDGPALDKEKYNGKKKQGQNVGNMKRNMQTGKFISPGKAKYSSAATCQSASFLRKDLCCSSLPKSLMSQKMQGKCGYKPFVRYLEDYLMNKFQTGNERLVFDPAAHPTTFVDAMKFVTCMFSKEGLMNGNTPSQEKMITAFTSHMGSSFGDLVSSAVSTCVQQIKKLKLPTWVKNGNEFVNPLPLMTAQCTIKVMVLDCNGDLQDDSCDANRNMLSNQCDIFKPAQLLAPQKGGFMKQVEQTIKNRQAKKG